MPRGTILTRGQYRRQKPSLDSVEDSLRTWEQELETLTKTIGAALISTFSAQKMLTELNYDRGCVESSAERGRWSRTSPEVHEYAKRRFRCRETERAILSDLQDLGIRELRSLDAETPDLRPRRDPVGRALANAKPHLEQALESAIARLTPVQILRAASEEKSDDSEQSVKALEAKVNELEAKYKECEEKSTELKAELEKLTEKRK